MRPEVNARRAARRRVIRRRRAVALGSVNAPEVLNATDRDWWDYREALERNGVRIVFLCPERMLR